MFLALLKSKQLERTSCTELLSLSLSRSKRKKAFPLVAQNLAESGEHTASCRTGAGKAEGEETESKR